MNEEILSEIRNKLTVPMVALERLSKGEKVPQEFLELASNEMKIAVVLLQELAPTDLNSRETLFNKR